MCTEKQSLNLCEARRRSTFTKTERLPSEFTYLLVYGILLRTSPTQILDDAFLRCNEISLSLMLWRCSLFLLFVVVLCVWCCISWFRTNQGQRNHFYLTKIRVSRWQTSARVVCAFISFGWLTYQIGSMCYIFGLFNHAQVGFWWDICWAKCNKESKLERVASLFVWN